MYSVFLENVSEKFGSNGLIVNHIIQIIIDKNYFFVLLSVLIKENI